MKRIHMNLLCTLMIMQTLQSEHERYLAEQHFKAPVVVKNYPKDIKAFYMKQNEDGKTVAAMDVLAPGIGEIIGGSQREDDLTKLDARMDELGLNKDSYWWYRDLRRYGSCASPAFYFYNCKLAADITGECRELTKTMWQNLRSYMM